MSNEEIESVVKSFTGQFAARDRALFVFGVKTGFRISEILSLTVADVYQNGHFVERVQVRRGSMKGKHESRSVILHPDAKAALEPWISQICKEGYSENDYLFKSRVGENRPISRVRAHEVRHPNRKYFGT